MGHYAKVLNNKVIQVIVAEAEFIDSLPATWIQTSYNTRGGIHYGSDGLPDGGIALRANYAGADYNYDSVHDVFYAPQPFPSWTISGPDWIWKAPVPMPDDGKPYYWNEESLSWISRS